MKYVEERAYVSDVSIERNDGDSGLRFNTSATIQINGRPIDIDTEVYIRRAIPTTIPECISLYNTSGTEIVEIINKYFNNGE